jgi:hypothetical protein
VAVWLLLFGAAVAVHRRCTAAIRRFQLYRNIKRTHRARMALDWDEIGPPPAVAAPPADHPFALDLDLLGPRSLMHLLDVSVSPGGSERLASWLLDPGPEAAPTLRRQQLVRELAPRTRFRDRLRLQALLAAGSGAEPAAGLQQWLTRRRRRAGCARCSWR